MPQGTVKWFNVSKRFGFIKQENGMDIFVHHTAIQSKGARPLNQGDRVVFEVGENRNGPVAEKVYKL
jgi:cold shock protein